MGTKALSVNHPWSSAVEKISNVFRDWDERHRARLSVHIAKSTLKLSKMLFTLLARAWSEIIRTCGEIMGTFLDFLCFEMFCSRLLFGFGQLICARLLVGTDDAKC
jgi:hypothetical protein